MSRCFRFALVSRNFDTQRNADRYNDSFPFPFLFSFPYLFPLSIFPPSTNTEVLKAMHTASKSLKKAHQDLDVDKISDLMDDIQEQQDVSIYR